jgi:S1-C subfamily serine protease
VARSGILSLRAAELAAVALVGGAVALGGAALLGKLGSHTTIQQISPVGGSGGVSNASLQAPAKGVTPETIYRRDAPGVVQIASTTTTTQTTDPFGFPATPQTQESLGSGFVIDKAGHIVTNYHVISGATRVQVSFSSQDKIDAKVVGADPSTDIAVLKIDTHSRALTPLPLGDSDAVRVGDQVYAIGNPFGVYTRTLTAGVVSALQRQIVAPNSMAIDGVIQTDAAINHGNSGGPLIDAAGRVIGVTSQISTGTTGEQGNIGIGFAIPVNTVRNVAAQIIKSGKVEHAVLGIRVVAITPQIAKLFNLPTKSGVMVDSVDKGGGADKAGIKGRSTDVVVQGETYPLGGDIIVSVDHAPVTTPEQLREAIARHAPGEKVGLELYRHGQKKTVTVKLGNAPEAVR